MTSNEYAKNPFEDFATKPVSEEPAEFEPMDGASGWSGGVERREARAEATPAYTGVGDDNPFANSAPKAALLNEDVGWPGEPVTESQWRHAKYQRVW